MRSLVVLVVGLATLIGCGQAATRPDVPLPQDDVTGPVSDRLYVARDGGLSVVDVASGKVVLEIAAGVTTSDWSTHYVVEARTGATHLRAVSPLTGAEIRRATIVGEFPIPSGYGPRADALSANDRWLVLGGPDGDTSPFVVVDTKDLREVARVDLPGTFTFDAIDDSASSLYLLEHPQPNSHLYNVRLFDLTTKTLAPRAIVDVKAASPSAEQLRKGTMGGIYHASATVSGFHFGFYTHPTKGPVIHSLRLGQRWARCLIDLAQHATHRPQWAIAESPDQAYLYVVNGATGAFASVTTSDELRVTARPLNVDRAAEHDLRGAAAISADGSRLYATGGRGLLVIDPRTATLRGQYLRDREFASVMVSPDGTRVYVLGVDGAISRIEPNTGRDLGVVARLPSAVSLLRVDR